ncbi:MAG TPA: hypothetical protein VMH85_08545 [Terriglobales bacterium]|nr:hypothetical protein [Terriglobales bacterium]
MPEINTSRLREMLAQVVGPAPWYWKAFPALRSPTGQKLVWTHHGEQGPLAYLVSLGAEEEPDKPLLALNTYCRPFPVTSEHLGIWCPEGSTLRLACFDLGRMKSFDFAEVAGWFKQSTERIYAATAPVAEFELPLTLPAGLHKIEVPPELQPVEELIAPGSYPAANQEDPAAALYVFYLHAGLVEVLPQKWLAAGSSDPGQQWIARAARDPESHRIFGDGVRIRSFLLEDDGQHLDRWMDEHT